MWSLLATSELLCHHLFFLLLGGLEAPSSVSSSRFGALDGLLAKGPRSHQVGAQASVLTTIIASATARVIAVVSSLSRIIVGTPASVEGIACAMVEAETLMHRVHGVLRTTLWRLVDRRVPAETL